MNIGSEQEITKDGFYEAYYRGLLPILIWSAFSIIQSSMRWLPNLDQDDFGSTGSVIFDGAIPNEIKTARQASGGRAGFHLHADRTDAGAYLVYSCEYSCLEF